MSRFGLAVVKAGEIGRVEVDPQVGVARVIAALQHLSVIRIKSDKIDRELSDSRTQVKDLTATQRELERVERELEGPVVCDSGAGLYLTFNTHFAREHDLLPLV